MSESATIATDASGWFKSVSPAFLELIGRPVESLAGVSLLDLVHPLDAAEARRVFTQPGAAAAPVRLFAAGDTWRTVQLGAAAAADGRVTVTLTPTAAPAVPDPSPFAEAPTVPIWSVSSAQSFPVSAGGESADYRASSDQVPQQRAAVRASVAADTPMLELDTEGHTTFVAGPWATLTESEVTGADAFEDLLERSGQSELVLDVIGQVTTTGSARQIQVATINGSRWIRVLPIPSPVHADVANALVAVTTTRADGEQVGQMTSAVTAASAELSASRPQLPLPADGNDTFAADDEPAVAAPVPDPAVQALESQDGEATTSETEAVETVVSAESDAAVATELDEEPDKGGRRFSLITLLTMAIAAVLSIVVLSKLWPSSDGTSDRGPIDIDIAASEPVETDDGQSWRLTGAAVGEAHGVAAISDGLLVAGVNGTIVELDSDGAARSAVSLGGDETAFVSDIATDSSGVAWALDAGRGLLFRIAPDGEVSEIPTDPGPLRNARGLGLSPDGFAWIASTASAQLVQIAPDGATLASIPLPGRQPSDVVDLGDGTLWLVDAEQLELVHLALDGEVLHTIEMEQFTSPYSPHLAVSADSLWVTDPEFSGVFEIDVTTSELTDQRVVLIRPEGVRVNKPIGIDIDNAGRLWIVDSTGGATTVIDQ